MFAVIKHKHLPIRKRKKAIGAVNSIQSPFADGVLRVAADERAVMSENFDRAPGAGRTRSLTADPAVLDTTGDGDSQTMLFNQREPLRQPRTSPPYAENSISTANDVVAGGRELS